MIRFVRREQLFQFILQQAEFLLQPGALYDPIAVKILVGIFGILGIFGIFIFSIENRFF